MIAYDVNHDGKADVIASSAHQYGIWWFEQGAREGRLARLHPPRPIPGPRLRNARPDRRGHQRRRPQGPGHRQTLLVTRPERGRLRQARPALLVRGQPGADGKIAFTPREIDDQSGIGTQFVVADFNGDGLLDIVTANKKGVFLLEQVRTMRIKHTLPGKLGP